MRRKLLAALFAVLSVPCLAEEYINGVQKLRYLPDPISSKIMSARLDYDAIKLRQYSPVPRVVEHDSAFGMDEEEHAKLNTYGVIMISAQCRDAAELPFKSVYLKRMGKKYPLACILQKNVGAGSAVSAEVFGPIRYDLYYLIPYGYTKLEGELCIDWKAHRSNFSLIKFPSKVNLRFVTNDKGFKPEKGASIDRDTLKNFLVREFSLSREDASKAAEAAK